MLTKITYPTGGYTQFNYEPNIIPVTAEQFTNYAVNNVLAISPTQTTTTQSVTFTTTKPQYVQLQFSSNISATTWGDQPTTKCYAYILDSSGTLVAQLTSSGQAYSNSQFYSLTSAGTYTLKVSSSVSTGDFSSGDAVNLNASISYSKSLGTQSFNQMVGGLRVKSILNYDGINASPVDDRYFTYASGFVINPVDSLNDYLTSQASLSSNGGEICYFNKITRNTSTKFSLGSIQGGVIGYGTVTTTYGPTGANGKTISYFSNVPDNGVTNATLFRIRRPTPVNGEGGFYCNSLTIMQRKK